MWVLGDHTLSGTTVTVFRNDYVDFSKDASIQLPDIFSIIFEHDNTDVPRFFPIPGGINSYIGTYNHNNFIIFVMVTNWIKDKRLFKGPNRFIGTFLFKHYDMEKRTFEDSSSYYIIVGNLPNRYVPVEGGNIFHLADSEDIVTIAYEAINNTSTNDTFDNIITTIDFLKDTLDAADVKIMEWNNVNNAY
jgi:hypothetical protein